MKMFKRATAMLFATVMMLGNVVAVSSLNASEASEASQIISQLESIDFGREVSILPINQSTTLSSMRFDEEMLHFDTVEEFEKFYRGFIASLEKHQMSNTTFNIPDQEEFFTTASPRAVFGPNRLAASWWTPAGGGPLVWANIEIHYTWFNFVFAGQTMPRIQSAWVNNSWATGLMIGTSWQHRSGSAMVWFSDARNNHVRATVNGTWTTTVSVAGIPVSAVVNDTWVRDFHVIRG